MPFCSPIATSGPHVGSGLCSFLAGPLLVPFLVQLTACGLLHEEVQNLEPVVQLASSDTTRVNRGGSVQFEVLASDENDDPLFYEWSSFGLGTFSDPSSAGTSWTAPEEIQGNSEIFPILVTIRDRNCSIVSARERARCEEEALSAVETFLIEVVQRPPFLTSPADTVVSFRTPVVLIDAFAEDPDGDRLFFNVAQVGGELAAVSDELIDENRVQVRVIPRFPGDIELSLAVTDGAVVVSAEFRVTATTPELPQGGSAVLELPLNDDSSHVYEIDLYEFPNVRGELPVLVDSWFEAARLCAERGQRLCTSSEWQFACSGPEGASYSSSDKPQHLPANFGRRFCNTVGSDIAGDDPDPGDLAPSGSFPNCSSSTGVFDLTGNAHEWLMDRNAFLDRIGGFSVSSVQIDLPCQVATIRQPLPPEEEFDLYSQEQVDEVLEQFEYAPYATKGFGFRCCR